MFDIVWMHGAGYGIIRTNEEGEQWYSIEGGWTTNEDSAALFDSHEDAAEWVETLR